MQVRTPSCTLSVLSTLVTSTDLAMRSGSQRGPCTPWPHTLHRTKSLYSSVAERQSCKLKVLGSIPSGGCMPSSCAHQASQSLCLSILATATDLAMRTVWPDRPIYSMASGSIMLRASIAQWQSVSLVNSRSWVQSPVGASLQSQKLD